ncbi:SseB family protein [Streptomyces kronopolitis]|uniref:SseB family protein n=1 Tax=Streptomyces kronopolitis TaxID=1612435 RepID=UPI003432C24E
MSNSSPDDHGPPAEDAAEGPSAQEAEETQAALIELATSVALLPQSPPAEGEEERPEGTISLPVIEQEGNRYVPVFTTEDALVAAGGDPGAAVRLPVVELAANWPADDLWLAVNPSTEQGLVLPPDLVRALPVFNRRNGEDGDGGGVSGPLDGNPTG